MPEPTRGGDICPDCDTGHITLRCRNHPEKTWSTKNIFGRSLFYNLNYDPAAGPECDCPGSALYHDHERDGRCGFCGKKPTRGFCGTKGCWGNGERPS